MTAVMYFRLLEELHDRTPSYLVLSGDYIIVGAGGTGTWTAIMIALSCREDTKITIVDDDVLEVHNMNRLPYPITWAFNKKSKAHALATYLQYIRPHLRVFPLQRRVESSTDIDIIVSKLKLCKAKVTVVDCTDSPQVQDTLRTLTDRYDYLGVHYDGENITVEWIPRGQRPATEWNIEDRQGYRIFPSVAYAPAIAAALATYILAIRPGKRLLISTSLNDIVNRLTT